MLDTLTYYLPRLFVLLCAVGIPFLIKNLIVGLWSYKWKSVTGKVLKVSLEHHSSSNSSIVRYTLCVEYEYFYKGNKYRGDKYSYNPQTHLDKDAADIQASRYLLNKDIEIKVNHSYPSMSVIEHGVDVFSFVALIMTIGFGGAVAFHLYPEYFEKIISLIN